jgi:hypothetical protein
VLGSNRRRTHAILHEDVFNEEFSNRVDWSNRWWWIGDGTPATGHMKHLWRTPSSWDQHAMAAVAAWMACLRFISLSSSIDSGIGGGGWGRWVYSKLHHQPCCSMERDDRARESTYVWGGTYLSFSRLLCNRKDTHIMRSLWLLHQTLSIHLVYINGARGRRPISRQRVIGGDAVQR